MKPLKVIGQWIVFNGMRIRISSIESYRRVGTVVDICSGPWGHNEKFENEQQAAYRLNELDIALANHANVDESL